MAELVDNMSQFLTVLLCCCISALYYIRSRRQAWFLMTCIYGCFALGGLYWTLYYFLFRETPQVFYVAEIAWISSYIFFFLLQYALSDEQERTFRCPAAWLSPLVGVPLMVFYCMHGDVLSSIIMSVLIMLMAWNAIRGLIWLRGRGREARDMRRVHAVILAFAVLEQCLWFSSCFWISDTLSNPYFWFDFMLTASFLALLPSVKKVVGP